MLAYIEALGWEIMQPACIPVLLVVLFNVAFVILPAICFGVDMGRNGYDFVICVAAFFVFCFVNDVMIAKSKRRIQGQAAKSVGTRQQHTTKAKAGPGILVKLLPAMTCNLVIGVVTAILRNFPAWSTETKFYVRLVRNRHLHHKRHAAQRSAAAGSAYVTALTTIDCLNPPSLVQGVGLAANSSFGIGDTAAGNRAWRGQSTCGQDGDGIYGTVPRYANPLTKPSTHKPRLQYHNIYTGPLDIQRSWSRLGAPCCSCWVPLACSSSP